MGKRVKSSKSKKSSNPLRHSSGQAAGKASGKAKDSRDPWGPKKPKAYVQKHLRRKKDSDRPFGGFGPKRDSRPDDLRTLKNLETAFGRIDLNQKGFGFLIFDFEAGIEDQYVSPEDASNFFDGERVKVTFVRRNQEIQIQKIDIDEGHTREVLGVVAKSSLFPGDERYAFHYQNRRYECDLVAVFSDELSRSSSKSFKELPATFYVKGKLKRRAIAENENRSVAKFLKKTVTSKPVVEICEILGEQLSAKMDPILASLNSGFSEEHRRETKAEADRLIKEQVFEKELSNPSRTDLTKMPFITIDGEKARDFDDAIFVEKKRNAWVLWVAIADVSFFVQEHGKIDEEAFERATSVYFPEKAFHMLPSVLSEHLCSLRPFEKRLTLSARIEWSHDFSSKRVELHESIIESHRRFTYTEFENFKKDETYSVYYEFSRMLRKRRFGKGSLDFDLSEAEIECDDDGEPIQLVARSKLEAHGLIEEFMIAANEAVTEWVDGKLGAIANRSDDHDHHHGHREEKKPFSFGKKGLIQPYGRESNESLGQKAAMIYRVHDDPAPKELEAFMVLYRKFFREPGNAKQSQESQKTMQPKKSRRSRGRKDDDFSNESNSVTVSPLEMQKLLERIREKPLIRPLLEYLLLRSLKKAHYTTNNVGHFGLASDAYTHFTSPIRRYPDLLVHRVVRSILQKKGSIALSKATLEPKAKHCSEQERLASDVERNAIKIKQVRFMKKRLGEVFTGMISGVSKTSLFVKLNDIFIEGVLPLEELTGDFYQVNEENQEARGKRTGKRITIGQTVEVQCLSADIDSRRIVFGCDI